MDVTNFRFQIANFRFQIVARRLRRCARIYARGLPATRYSLPATPFRLLPADYADLRGFVHIPSLGGGLGRLPFPLSFILSPLLFPRNRAQSYKKYMETRCNGGGVASKYLQTHFASFRLRVPRLPGNRLGTFAPSRTPEIPSVRGKIFAVTRLKFRSNAAKIP